MIDSDDSDDLTAGIAQRLLITRTVIGISQLEFGKGAGLSQPQYHQYESGKRRLTLDAALSLCSAYNLTLDWLYRGDLSGLPHRLVQQIETLRR
ncbi:MAG: helix-turn-helix domain-containing protein [Hyphomicrobiaceae bacterium]